MFVYIYRYTAFVIRYQGKTSIVWFFHSLLLQDLNQISQIILIMAKTINTESCIEVWQKIKVLMRYQLCNLQKTLRKKPIPEKIIAKQSSVTRSQKCFLPSNHVYCFLFISGIVIKGVKTKLLLFLVAYFEYEKSEKGSRNNLCV